MGKVIFLVLIALCMVSVAFASTIYIHDTVKPDIEAKFEDIVNLTGYSLIYGADDSSIPLEEPTTDNDIKFMFTPKQPLYNGVYLFTVYAEDEIGNPKEFKRTVIIDVEQTTIYFKEPLHGIGDEKEFEITIRTSAEAICKWDFFGNKAYDNMPSDSFSGETSMRLEHKIPKMSWKNIEVQTPDTIYVKCIDKWGLLVEEQLVVGYDPTAPVIAVTTNSPVVIYPPTGIIMVDSTDYSVCYIDGQFFKDQNKLDIETYTPLPVHTISYDEDPKVSNGDYTYRIQCENLAGTLSDSKTAAIKVDLKEKLAIVSIESPKSYIKGGQDLVYKIITNKEASNCNALLHKPNGKTTETRDFTDSADKIFHSKTFGQLENGSYIVDFECTGGANERAPASKAFIVDSTAPTLPKINATACSDDELELDFYAYDNESGIKGYNYSVSGENVSINWTFTSNKEVEISDLEMVMKETYTIKAIAINNAGIISTQAGTATFIFNPNVTVACQEKEGPIVTLNISDTTYGKSVGIKCYDESGCDTNKIYYGKSETDECNTTASYSNPVKLYQPSTFCWIASDIWGNKAEGSKFITFETLGTTCANGILDGIESDIDCGGDCLGCAVGLDCNIHGDCSDNWCVDGICKKPLCDDTIKNGFESDIDCGGSVCNSCAIGKQCSMNSDCITNYCYLGAGNTTGICEATSCTDGIKNGFETDVDCGGSACDKCGEGKDCIEDDDCLSDICQFSTCTGAKTFEQCAEEYGLDPTNKEGDEDKDGLTNEQECLYGTNPNNKDSDGDGYSDGKEIKAGTDPLDGFDFPVSNFYRYLLLFLGLIVLAVGIAFFYYFKTDQQTAIAMTSIGAALLLFLIIDLLLFMIPKPILLVIALAGLGGAGYFIYKNQKLIIEKLPAGIPFIKKPKIIQPVQISAEIGKPGIKEAKPSIKEMEATKTMLEMMRKQREERERKRESIFKKFLAPAKQAEQKERMIIEPIKKAKIIKKAKPNLATAKQSAAIKKEKIAEKKKARTEFERLSEISGKRTGKESMGPSRKSEIEKEEAFGRLSTLTKSRAEDVFKKLPHSERGMEELEKMHKRKAKKKGKK